MLVIHSKLVRHAEKMNIPPNETYIRHLASDSLLLNVSHWPRKTRNTQSVRYAALRRAPTESQPLDKRLSPTRQMRAKTIHFISMPLLSRVTLFPVAKRRLSKPGLYSKLFVWITLWFGSCLVLGVLTVGLFRRLSKPPKRLFFRCEKSFGVGRIFFLKSKLFRCEKVQKGLMWCLYRGLS